MNAPFSAGRVTVRLAELHDPNEVRRLEAYVLEHSEGTLFHRPLWLAAIERGTGQFSVGLVAERAGLLTGWLPLSEVHSPLFGRTLVSTGFGVAGGALGDDAATALHLCRAAEELAARLSCPTVELRGGPSPLDWDKRTDSHCGFVRKLADDAESEMLAIPRRQRAEVRRGLGLGLAVESGSRRADRAGFFDCYAESVRNLGTPVFPVALFDAMLELFQDDADILTVRHHGEAVSSVLSFYYKGAVLPFWGGGKHIARSLRANDVLYFKLMRHAHAKGCDRFDFGRSKTGSGAYHFKKNWGFDPQPLSYASWHADGAARRNIDPLSPRYAARIVAWKKLPLPVANFVGPFISRGLG